MSVKLGKSLSMSGDLYPSDIAPVLASNKQGKIAIFPMAWGFTHKATPKPLANCRIETADRKTMWRDSWYRRRCVIPASWYYEWGYPVYEKDSRSMVGHRNTKKVKFAIQTEGSDITYIAGLYRYEEHSGMQIPMFTVLTKEAVGIVRDIHDLMPLILDKEDVKDWIRPDRNPSAIVEKVKSVYKKAAPLRELLLLLALYHYSISCGFLCVFYVIKVLIQNHSCFQNIRKPPEYR